MLQAIAENEALLDKLSLLSSAESKRINVHSAESRPGPKRPEWCRQNCQLA
jgi:hypothetical protein